MKAARRHELKTNALYARVNQAWAWMQGHRSALVVLVLLGLGVTALLYLWVQRQLARPREAWTALGACQTEQQYRALLDEYGSTRAATHGRLEFGRILMSEGKYEEARGMFQAVLDGADEQSYDGARALLGLATLAEQQDRPDEALQHYRAIRERYAAAGFAMLAADRMRVLESPHRPIAPPPERSAPPRTEVTVPLSTQPAGPVFTDPTLMHRDED